MLASALLGRLTANNAGGVTCTGGIIATGLTIDPGGIDVMQASTFRNNLTVQETLFVTEDAIVSGDILGAWASDELVAPGQDLTVALAGGADADYEWEAFVEYNAANQSILATLSGSNANLETVLAGMGIANIATGTGVVFTGGGMGAQTGELSNNVGAGATVSVHFVRGRITQRTGLAPVVTVDGYEVEGATRNLIAREVRRTTTGAITSFGLHTASATGMNTGAWLRVRQISP